SDHIDIPRSSQDTAPTDINTLSLHDALPIFLTSSIEESYDFINAYAPEHLEILSKEPFDHLGRISEASEILLGQHTPCSIGNFGDRKSTRLNSSHVKISYAVFCLKKKTKIDFYLVAEFVEDEIDGPSNVTGDPRLLQLIQRQIHFLAAAILVVYTIRHAFLKRRRS